MNSQTRGSPPPAESKANFSSWKFDMIDGLLSDPRVPDGHFRIAVRVLQGMDEGKRTSYLSDETICDEVPRTDRHKCNDARKKLEQLGWWSVRRGHGTRASSYELHDDNLNPLLDQRIIKREERHERRKRQKEEGRKPKERKSRDVVKSPRKIVPDVVELPHRDVVELPPVHLGVSPRSDPLPEEGRGYAYAREAAGDWCAEDWQARFDEIAGVLEYDQGLSRKEADALALRLVDEERRASILEDAA